MGTTELRRQGADLNRISDRMRRFALEYLVDYDGKNAVIRAGYSKKGASVRACALLKHKIIKAFLGKFERKSQERFEIERNDILRHLAACALRNGKDFVDKGGKLLLDGQNINDLPDAITCAIDGIKQKRKTYTMKDGTQVEKLETEVKLVSKALAIDMAMKHKGLFEAEKVEHLFPVDWDTLYAKRQDTIDVDPIQKRLQDERDGMANEQDAGA